MPRISRDRVLGRQELDRLLATTPVHLIHSLLTADYTGTRRGELLS